MLVYRLRFEGLKHAHVELPSSDPPHTSLPLYFYVLPLLCRRNPHSLSTVHNNTHTPASLFLRVVRPGRQGCVCARSRFADRVSPFDRDTDAPPRTWHRSGCRTGRPERERSPSSCYFFSLGCTVDADGVGVLCLRRCRSLAPSPIARSLSLSLRRSLSLCLSLSLSLSLSVALCLSTVFFRIFFKCPWTV